MFSIEWHAIDAADVPIPHGIEAVRKLISWVARIKQQTHWNYFKDRNGLNLFSCAAQSRQSYIADVALVAGNIFRWEVVDLPMNTLGYVQIVERSFSDQYTVWNRPHNASVVERHFQAAHPVIQKNLMCLKPLLLMLILSVIAGRE